MAMVIDPWTQRWAIVENGVHDILALVDGTQTVAQIAEAARSRGLDRFSDRELLKGLLDHLRDAGIVYSSKAHHEASGLPVYNSTNMKVLHLEITNACNLRCRHCYVGAGDRLANELTTEELKAVIDQLTPFSDTPLVISGGEPVLRGDCMELVEYAAIERGLPVHLYSNAYKFPSRVAERLVAINEIGPGSVMLQVSLEGATPETNDAVRGKGVFAEVSRTVQELRRLGLNRRLVLLICLTSSNIHEVQDMIRLAEDWDVATLHFSQWQRQGNAADTPWASIAPTTEQWCAAGEQLLAHDDRRTRVTGAFFGDLNNNDKGRYSLDGGLFPKHLYAYYSCPRIAPDGSIFADQLWTDPEWSLGNVRETSLEDAYRSPSFREQLESFRERLGHVTECQECTWLHLCECGSPGHTFAEYGDVDHRDLFCESRKYWFQRYVDRQIDAAAARLARRGRA